MYYIYVFGCSFIYFINLFIYLYIDLSIYVNLCFIGEVDTSYEYLAWIRRLGV